MNALTRRARQNCDIEQAAGKIIWAIVIVWLATDIVAKVAQ